MVAGTVVSVDTTNNVIVVQTKEPGRST